MPSARGRRSPHVTTTSFAAGPKRASCSRATVTGTERDQRARVLRFASHSQDSECLLGIDWDEWFDTSDQCELVFLYKEHLRNGDQSNFFRLDSPHREDA